MTILLLTEIKKVRESYFYLPIFKLVLKSNFVFDISLYLK